MKQPRARWAELIPGRLYQVGGSTQTGYKDDAAGYLITNDNKTRIVEIDPGHPDAYVAHMRNVRSLARKLNIGNRAIKETIFLGTHGHYDHIGSMCSRLDRTVYIGRPDIAGVEARERIATAAALYSRGFPGLTAQPIDELPGVEQYEIEGINGLVYNLDDSTSIEIFATPGHTPGSLTFVAHTPDGNAMIAGDTLYGMETLGLSNPKQWLDSLLNMQVIAEAESIRGLTFGHGVDNLVETPFEHLSKSVAAMNARIETNFVNPWQCYGRDVVAEDNE